MKQLEVTCKYLNEESEIFEEAISPKNTASIYIARLSFESCLDYPDDLCDIVVAIAVVKKIVVTKKHLILNEWQYLL